jgi:hypothetical protein
MKRFIVMALILGSIAHAMGNQATQAIGKRSITIEKALGD